MLTLLVEASFIGEVNPLVFGSLQVHGICTAYAYYLQFSFNDLGASVASSSAASIVTR